VLLLSYFAPKLAGHSYYIKNGLAALARLRGASFFGVLFDRGESGSGYPPLALLVLFCTTCRLACRLVRLPGYSGRYRASADRGMGLAILSTVRHG